MALSETARTDRKYLVCVPADWGISIGVLRPSTLLRADYAQDELIRSRLEQWGYAELLGASSFFPEVPSTLGIQDFATNLHRFGIDENESDDTRLTATIDPVMNSPALHQYVPGS